MKSLFLTVGLLVCACLCTFAQQEYPAKVEKATIYLQGAALTHTASANLKSGSYEVLITGLSPDIESNSLKVSANGVLISASEFSNDFVTPKAESAHINKLQDSVELYKGRIQEAEDELTVHTHLLKLLSEGTLNNMQQKEGTVSVADINANMELYKSKAAPLQKSIAQDNLKIASLKETLQRLNLQLSQDMSKEKLRTGVLRLSVSVPQNINTTFTVTYYTYAASWVPCYEINIPSMDKPVAIQGKAMVQQFTGLDWSNVRLTLSNATPNRTKEAPVFKPWFLTFRNTSAARGYTSVRSNLVTYELAETSAVSSDAASAKNNMVSGIMMDDFVNVDMQDVYVNYNIAVPYDIPGNGKEQLIELKNYNVKSEYKYYSVPKLSDETYLIATLSDYEQYNLLPGYATVTFNNTFVGKTYLRPNSTEKNIPLTLTTDPRVTVKREKQAMFSSTKHVGNTTTETQSYLITVKNNQTVSIDLTLKEQYPLSSDKDIEVKVTEVKPDATYDKSDVGVLTWDVKLNAGETKTFNVTYSVKYPKDRKINL